MVFEKRLDYYGFNGYWAPAVPRASRSARRKRSFRRKTEENQLYAFDLLATVAGELLLLKESSRPSSDKSPGRAENVAAKDTVKSESRDEEKPFKHDPCGKGGSLESASAAEVGLHKHDADYSLKGCLHAQDDVTLLPTSMKVKFESSEKVYHADQSLPGKVKDDPIQGICHTESHSPGLAESHDSKVDIAIKGQLKVGKQVIGDTINGTAPDIFMTEDPKELDVNTPMLVSSDSGIGAPLCGDHISSGLFLTCQDDVKIVVSRDDDENSSRCTQPCIPLKAFRPPHLGNQRIRKLLASKFSRVAPRLLKDGKHYNKDFETKPIFRGKESCYTRQRTQWCSPFKRRKIFGRNSASMFEASRVSTPVAGRESSFKCDDSRVKLSIKSFRVPELFIEIPETATVGSLKEMAQLHDATVKSKEVQSLKWSSLFKQHTQVDWADAVSVPLKKLKKRKGTRSMIRGLLWRLSLLYLEVDYELVFFCRGRRLEMTIKLCFRLELLVMISWKLWVLCLNPTLQILHHLYALKTLIFYYHVMQRSHQPGIRFPSQIQFHPKIFH